MIDSWKNNKFMMLKLLVLENMYNMDMKLKWLVLENLIGYGVNMIGSWKCNNVTELKWLVLENIIWVVTDCKVICS